MTELSALEDVVRVIFPATMMREGELLPAAFKLREHAGEAETYVSVFRQYADTFADDISQFHMLAIRRRLVEIAKKRMTTVNGLIVK